MQAHWIDALSSAFLVSLISLIGNFFISLDEVRLRSTHFVLVGLAAGEVLGGALIHLLPGIPQEAGDFAGLLQTVFGRKRAFSVAVSKPDAPNSTLS